jgi:hypothetical protein
MKRFCCSAVLACAVLIRFCDGSAWASPPGPSPYNTDQITADETKTPAQKATSEPPSWAVPILAKALKRGSNLMAMETMLQITVLSRVRQMPLSDLLKAPIVGPKERKPLTLLAASWDEMIETMKKEGLTPLRLLAVTTIYTEAAPNDPHFHRETVSFYGFRPIALLPEMLNPQARKPATRTDDAHFMEEAVSDSVGWNTIVNRIRGEKSDPNFAPDLDVQAWITYLVDRHREGKTEKNVVTRELHFSVRDGEIQAAAVKR